MSGVRALVVRIGKSPKDEVIGTDLAAIQKVVGGWVQVVRLGRGLALWCNEDGIAQGLAPNRTVRGPGGEHVIHGDFFFTRLDDEGEPIDLDFADDEFLCSTLFRPPGGDFI